MGKSDVITLSFMQNPVIFADAFNCMMYRGRRVIKPESLSEIDPTMLWFDEEKYTQNYIKKLRDLFKQCAIFEDKKQTYLLLGIENQSEIDVLMPFRVMLYDALAYDRQIRQLKEAQKEQKKQNNSEFLSGITKDTRLYPVITLVCNFSQGPWDGPKCIHDMLTVQSPRMLRYIQNYSFLLFDPYQMSNRKLKAMNTDLGLLARCMRLSRNRSELKNLVNTDERFTCLKSSTLQTISHALKIRIPDKYLNQENGNMCQAWKEMLQEERDEGRAEGKDEGIDIGRAEGEERKIESFVKKLLDKHFSDEMITELVEISPEKLADVKLKLQMA